jgi:hypothetical protein
VLAAGAGHVLGRSGGVIGKVPSELSSYEVLRGAASLV